MIDKTSPSTKAFGFWLAVLATIFSIILTWVAPRIAAGRTQGIEQFIFTPFDSFQLILIQVFLCPVFHTNRTSGV